MWDDPRALRQISTGLFVLCGVMFLVGAMHVLVSLPVFALRAVKLTDAPQRASVERIEATVRRELRGNFFTADLGRLKQALEQLPWVRKAAIHRSFPWALEVKLEEQQAVAHWNDTALVNRFGEVFEVGEYADDGSLPAFYGQAGTTPEILQMYAALSDQAKPLRRSITTVGLSPRYSWSVKLDNGLLLELGRGEVEKRLGRFVAAYPYTVGSAQRDASYVDLRYRNGFAVRYSGAEKPAGMASKGKA